MERNGGEVGWGEKHRQGGSDGSARCAVERLGQRAMGKGSF